jgi:hypothetical protein
MKNITLLAIAMLAALTTGCRQYEPQVFEVIENSESAFVIPLDESGEQASFDSEAYLESAKVASKRIQIPHRWVKDGYTYLSGKYLPTLRVIVVDHTP